MTYKIFCDSCGEEIVGKNKAKPDSIASGALDSRLAGYKERNGCRLFFEIIPGVQRDGTGVGWNSGDWCKYCIIDAVDKYDDRPKVA